MDLTQTSRGNVILVVNENITGRSSCDCM